MIAGNFINDYSNANKEKIDKFSKGVFISYTQKKLVLLIPLTKLFYLLKCYLSPKTN